MAKAVSRYKPRSGKPKHIGANGTAGPATAEAADAETALADPPDADTDTEEATAQDDTAPEAPDASEPKQNRGGRPRKADNPVEVDKSKTFFDLVRSIPAEDWGVRAYIYLYITMPICDLKGSGGSKYFKRFNEPFYDLEAVAAEAGSTQGRLTLNGRRAGSNNTTLLDTYDYSIIDPSRPCKIPGPLWKNDPRNAGWLSLLPPEEKTKVPGQATPQAKETSLREISGMLESVLNMGERLADRQTKDQGSASQEFLNFAKAAKELAPPPPPPPPKDDSMMATVIALFGKMMDAADRRAEAAEKRSEALLTTLITQKNQPPPTPQQNGDGIDKFLTLFEKIETFRERITGDGDAGGPPRKWWQSAIETAVPEGIKALSTIFQAIQFQQQLKAQQQQAAPQPQQQPAVAQLPAPTIVQAPPPQSPAPHQGLMLDPVKSLMDALRDDVPGERFAEDLYNVSPDLYEKAAGIGKESILTMLRTHPAAQQIAAYAGKLDSFVEAFLSFQKTLQEEDNQPAAGPTAVTTIRREQEPEAETDGFFG